VTEQRFYNDTDHRQCDAADEDGRDCAAPERHDGPHANVHGEWVDEARGELSDTTGCDGLAVRTATTAVGVICLTLCPACAEVGRLPRHVGMAELVTLSFGHRSHLGVTADEMAAAITTTDHTVFHRASTDVAS
jgi:hypothetical protein